MNTSSPRLKIFLSYSHEDKKLAGSLKKELESYGLEVFLAHHTIKPLQQWRDEIEKALDECAIFLPLLSENFKKSDWTDQESGIAYAKEKVILPINAGVQPYAFLAYIQSCPLDADKPGGVVMAAQKIVQCLAKNPRLTELFKNLLINGLKNADSFHKTKFVLELLNELEPFTPQQLDHIVHCWCDNDQVYGYTKGIPILEGLISRNETRLLQETRQILEEARQQKPPVVFPAG